MGPLYWILCKCVCAKYGAECHGFPTQTLAMSQFPGCKQFYSEAQTCKTSKATALAAKPLH